MTTTVAFIPPPPLCEPSDALVEGCHVAVIRALEYAGKRMTSRPSSHGGPGRSIRAYLRDQLEAEPHRVYLFAPIQDDLLDFCLDGAWSCLCAARDDADVLLPVVDRYVRQLLLARIEHSRDYLRMALSQAGVCGG